MAYCLNILEEELKNKVAQDYFGDFDCTRIIKKIDFCAAPKVDAKQKQLFEAPAVLWAEAKKGNKADLNESFVQLILTIGRERIADHQQPPNFLGAFDAEKIAFIEYYQIAEVFSKNDFNWNVTPSNHKSREFKALLKLVQKSLDDNALLFQFDEDDKELKRFIKDNLKSSNKTFQRISINKNNFIPIYSKWRKDVMPSIHVDWENAKQNMILDADFYLADLLSEENKTIKEKLSVLLKSDHYEFGRQKHDLNFTIVKQANFTDGQHAHHQFWTHYERPPKEEYWNFIIERRDLLVPQDFRERKGAFYTPEIWVNKSQEYIAQVLGEDWQDEYYVWDCAAGTGNLLNGLTNKYNIWASTLDQSDVDIMKDRVKNGHANLLEDHIFKFDFLNDDFDSLPPLKQIVTDKNKRKKLVIYINPPYAEAASATTTSGTGKHKTAVSNVTAIHQKYLEQLGKSARELFVQFFVRVYEEIPGSILAEFSTLKIINGPNFKCFRNLFNSTIKKGFIVQSTTFDNVGGDFPIGFFIWDTGAARSVERFYVDVFDRFSRSLKEKELIFGASKIREINSWLKKYVHHGEEIGTMSCLGNDFQHNQNVHISHQGCVKVGNAKGIAKFRITNDNIIQSSIYFSCRCSILHTWINHNDQFLYPNDGWQRDLEFQADCLAYTLFHGKNRISCENGVNHWIPFREAEVDAKEKFESSFMADFIAGKLTTGSGDLFSRAGQSKARAIEFSQEAQAVFDAGRDLWRYYHAQPRANPNASFYDIRGYFQGFTKGRMNPKSTDEEYNRLIQALRRRMKFLAAKIEPKIYEYGFLMK